MLQYDSDQVAVFGRRPVVLILVGGLLFTLTLGLAFAGWTLLVSSPVVRTSSYGEGTGCPEAAVAGSAPAEQGAGAYALAAAETPTGTTPYAYLPLVMQGPGPSFTFAVTADMRNYSGPGAYDTAQYFRGACEAIEALGAGIFMVSPGDIDPPADVEWTIKQYVGQDYLWYPVVGNHEAETPEDMTWLRSYDYDPNGQALPNIVNVGPAGCEETTFSFDYGNSHFAVLNEYCDGTSDTGTDGDVGDVLYEWLVDDLNATDQRHVFVLGHEPAFPQPDADNGRVRHLGDSLDKYPANRNRFWNLLMDRGVAAYICGHTHNYSAVELYGVWQLDTGHARGMGDTGARSTFILIHVAGDVVTFETYRYDASGGLYVLTDSGILD